MVEKGVQASVRAAARRYVETIGQHEGLRSYGLTDRPIDLESLNEHLTSFGLSLLAGDAATGGTTKCNDGSGEVPCDYILRPYDAPYYRCRGHAPTSLLRQQRRFDGKLSVRKLFSPLPALAAALLAVFLVDDFLVLWHGISVTNSRLRGFGVWRAC
jgi:hypothetical protein